MRIQDALRQCRKEQKAILAVNFYNFETLLADLEASRELNTPIILQTSESTLKYLGVKTAAAMARNASEEQGVRTWLHMDHGMNVDLIHRCLDAGYDSVMIDASELPLSENIAKTRSVVEMAESYGANVEAELGYIAKLGQSQDINCTPPEDAKLFAEETGIDALAVAIGNAHGFYKSTPKLHFDVLEEIARKVTIPLVLHGSSGIPGEDVQHAVRLGISKINLATEIKNAFMKKVKSILSESDEIDLRIVFPQATLAAKDLIAGKISMINKSKEYV